jgi:hypothetical protein
VFSPKGDRIVTGGLNEDPKVHSPHHRGIFYGFNRITYGDGKRAIPGTASTERFSSTNVFSRQRKARSGRHRVVISWHGKDAAFAEEEREASLESRGLVT